MSRKVIEDMLGRDIKSVTSRMRGLKQRISNTRNNSDIYSSIKRAFEDRGYTYSINREQKMFTINVSSNIYIIGKVGKISIKLGMGISLDDVQCTSDNASCGWIDFPVSDLEVYLPLIDKMMGECAELNEKYVGLLKNIKSAKLLKTLVMEYLESNQIVSKGINVYADENGTFWVSTILGRAPIDFSNYKSQCDKWFGIKKS